MHDGKTIRAAFRKLASSSYAGAGGGRLALGTHDVGMLSDRVGAAAAG